MGISKTEDPTNVIKMAKKQKAKKQKAKTSAKVKKEVPRKTTAINNEGDATMVKGKEATAAAGTKPSRKRKYTHEWFVEACKVFQKEFKHCKIKTTDKILGVRVQEYRRNYKLQMSGKKARSPIPLEVIQELNTIGFHWGFKPKAGMPQSEEMWEKCYKMVVEYHEEHGSFDVDPDEDQAHNAPPYCLAEWVCEQRNQKKRRDSKMKCNINPNRIKKLEKLDFNWSGARKLEAASSKKK